MEQHHRIDKQGQEEVNDNAAQHNEQPLPCRFNPKLPRLGGFGHLFCVERLVYHSRNLAISAQRQPAHAVGRAAFLRLKLEEMKPRVEE